MTKERKGSKHFKHSCRYFETSDEEDNIREYIELVLSGMLRTHAAKKCKLGINVVSRYIISSKDFWESLPDKGRGSKYSYIKIMQTFSSAISNKSQYGVILDFLIESYKGNDFVETKRKAEKFDALIALIR